MSRLLRPPPDEAVVVRGTEQTYECATIQAVDAHLKDLSDRIVKAGSRFPKLTAAYRGDQDLLLARRSFLVWTAVPSKESA
jgi:hypothetical protein